MEIPGYTDFRALAEGGMASVFTARQQSLNRQVAIKVLKKFEDEAQSQRFLNEGRIIASLNHRNIITIYDIGRVGNYHFISMEYLQGGDLEQRISRGVSVDDALDLIIAIGGCLDFVHRKGIVHRDVKPANILFHSDGTPILTDFGVAKQEQVDSRLTMDGTAVGSPYYLSPEQAECKPVDGRADIYGLGVILYEMLTGQKPYQGGTHMETLIAHITEPVPTLPAELQHYQQLICRMLAKKPERRFSTAAELVENVIEVRSEHRKREASLWHRIGQAATPISSIHADNLENKSQSVLDTGRNLRSKVHDLWAWGVQRLRTVEFDRRLTVVASAVVLVFVVAVALIGRTGDSSDSTQSILVADYLSRGENAVQEGNLSSPEGDNAWFYYTEALTLDPTNEEARVGLAKVVDAYADLVATALNRYQYGRAKQFLQRGLELDPDNERLLYLSEETKLKHAPKKFLEDIKQAFSN